MTAVTKRNIDKDKLDCISSSSLTIKYSYLLCTLPLSYNYLILWLTYFLLIRL